MSSFGERINQFKAKNSSSSTTSHSGSGGVTGSRHSSATIVPSFRFNKADDQMVEVTPSSSFDEMDEVISHADFGSVQDSSYKQIKPTKRDNDQFYDDIIDTGSSSLIDFGSIDEFYGADHVSLTNDDISSSRGGDDMDGTNQGQVESRSQPASLSVLTANGGRVESSPIKEAILNKFAKLAPSSTTNTMSGNASTSLTEMNGQSTESEAISIHDKDKVASDSITENRAIHAADTPTSSWLGQVKGRIAKTVQEKYSEYKHESELRKQAAAAAITIPRVSNEGLNEQSVGHQTNEMKQVDDNIDWPKGISHSSSFDGNLSEPSSLSSSSAEKLMSEMHPPEPKASKSIENLGKGESNLYYYTQASKEIERIMEENKKKREFDFEQRKNEEESSLESPESKTPVPEDGDENPIESFSKSKNTENSQNKNISPTQTPERMRRRYFPSLYSSFRSSKTNSPQLANIDSANIYDPVSDNIEDMANNSHKATDTNSSVVGSAPAVTHTPSKGSIKNRVWNLMGKTSGSNSVSTSSQPVSIPTSESNIESFASMSMRELSERSPLEDPFSGLGTSFDMYDKISPDRESSPYQEGEDEVEAGIEADEYVFVKDPDTPVNDDEKGTNGSVDAEVIVQTPETYSFWPLENLQFWWMAALPLCVILLLQILPLPSWLIGFVTGILIAVPLSAYVTYLLFGQPLEPITPFIEDIKPKVAKRPAIIVQEELERKFVWMNLWPTKKGAYDPLSYDVRRTSTVRIMLHGPWIEMRFPKRNLPLRRMHDDVEPKKVDYHDQVEVIDLSTCSIDLLPENLPSKRMWSKKYPIRIRTNMRKQTALNSETSKQMKAKTSHDGDDSDDEHRHFDDGKDETKNEFEGDTTNRIITHPSLNSPIQRSLETMGQGNRQSKYDKDKPKNPGISLSKDGSKASNNEHFDDEDFFIDAFDDEWTAEQPSQNKENSSIMETLNQRPTTLAVPSRKNDSIENCDNENIESDNIGSETDGVKNIEDPDGPSSAFKAGVVASQSEDSLSKEENPYKTFYLFTRTGREKEEWYNRFMVAANFMEDWEHQNPKSGEEVDPNYETQKVREQKFRLFMEDYFQAKSSDLAMEKHKETKETPENIQCAKEQVAFLNVYLARMWHDLHDSKAFLEFLREKISRKLLKVKIADYFNDIRVTQLDLGPKLPQILSASLPWQDELGLWVNLEIEYSGVCQATVETRGIRLPGKDEPDRDAQELLKLISRQAATMDSDEEDSAEEDDEPLIEDDVGDNDIPVDKLQPHAGFKARMLDKMLKSDFVAKVAESEWVKKNITSRNITLQLQLHVVKGILTLNFPPAPSDRIWYGFRTPPQLELALKPCFGGHSLGKYEGTLSAVMRQIVRRLKQEFIKVLVFPNLDDLDIPFMDHISYSMGGTGHNSPMSASGGKTDVLAGENNANENLQEQPISNDMLDTKMNITV